MKRVAVSFLVLFASWGIAIFPSTFEPAWGSLDDGNMLTIAAAGLNYCFQWSEERSVQAFRLRNWAIFQAAGEDPAIWYAVQALEFLLILVLIWLAISLVSGPSWEAVAASLIFVTSSPIAENVYTVSKMEPRAALFSALVSFCLVLLVKIRVLEPALGSPRVHRTGWVWTVLAVAVILAVFSKESAITMIVMAPAGLVLGMQRYWHTARQRLISTFSWLGAVFLLAAGVLAAVRSQIPDRSEPGYTDIQFSLAQINSNLRIYLEEAPDIFIMMLVGGLLGSTSVWGLFRRKGPGDIKGGLLLLLGIISLAAGLGYLGLLLIWKWSLVYYLLPVSLFFSLSAGFMLAAARGSRPRQILFLAVALILVSRLYSVPYLHFISRAQRGFDGLEATVAREAPKYQLSSARLLDLQRASFHEQPVQRNLLNDLLGQENFEWVGGAELLREFSEEEIRRYKATGRSGRQLVQEGELVLVQSGDYPFSGIHLRGIGPFNLPIGEVDARLQKFTAHTRLDLVPVRNWRFQTTVFKPWTLSAQRLIFVLALYRTKSGKPHSGRTHLIPEAGMPGPG